jgi:hypothetical protein
MAAGVGFLEINDGQARVVLERFQVLMAKEIFDVPEVGATPDEFRGAGAPKRVCRDGDGHAGVTSKRFQLSAKHMVRQPVAVTSKPDCPFLRLPQQQGSDAFQVALKKAHRGPAKRYDPPFVAFAVHPGHGVPQVDGIEVHAEQFGDSDAGRIQQLQHSPELSLSTSEKTHGLLHP